MNFVHDLLTRHHRREAVQSTIKSKLEAGEYTGDGADDEAAVDAFASDVRLLYRNAVT